MFEGDEMPFLTIIMSFNIRMRQCFTRTVYVQVTHTAKLPLIWPSLDSQKCPDRLEGWPHLWDRFALGHFEVQGGLISGVQIRGSSV